MKRNLVSLCVVGIFIAAVIGINQFEPTRVFDERLAEKFKEEEAKARARTVLARASIAEQDELIKKQNAQFFVVNTKRKGVHTLPSGVQYRVLKEGTGRIPTATDNVLTHYRGRLLDGTLFDSTYRRGRPELFNVSGVIKGWSEVLQLMKEGALWEVWIPSELAYGSIGQRPFIRRFAALTFELELVQIEG